MRGVEIKLQLGLLHFEADHLSGKSVAILQPVYFPLHRYAQKLKKFLLIDDDILMSSKDVVKQEDNWINE